MRREKIQHIVAIIEECVSMPFELGKNDCNLLVLKAIDVLCDTEYTQEAYEKYDSVTGGIKVFKEHGYDGLEDLVLKHGELTEFPTVGDIMIDGLHASVCLHDCYVTLDYDKKIFQVEKLTQTTKETKKFYRVK